LTIANQAGWIIRCPIGFTATWRLEQGTSGRVEFHFGTAEVHHEAQVRSHFGSGIITFTIPYLFRTPPGVGLIARGIPNEAKLNCAPLEGLVETDWSVSTFTMNWRILQPHVEVTFAKGALYLEISANLDKPAGSKSARRNYLFSFIIVMT